MKQFAAVLVAVLAICSVASAQAVPAKQKPTVMFSGEGKVSAVPDQVRITCSIWGQNANGKLAREQQALLSKNASEFLKKAGLEDKSFKTTSYRYAPVYDYSRDQQKNVLLGYRAEQELHVCAPIAQASTLVDGLAEQGFIGEVEFTVSNLVVKREEAVKLAIDDAKAKAKKRATDLGIKLGKMVGYSEGGGGGDSYVRAQSTRDAGPGGAPSLPAGENEIRAKVSVMYEIE